MLVRPSTLNPTGEVWTAFLMLSASEQVAFLAHAAGYHAAVGALAAVGIVDAISQDDLACASHRVPCPTTLAAPSSAPAAAQDPGEIGTGTASASANNGPQLPLLGGSELDLAPRRAFREPAFATSFRPGRVVYVYVAGTPGLKALMRPLGLHAYAVGVDAGVEARKVGIARDVSARMAQLSQTRHGSRCKASPTPEPGFDAWRAEVLTVGGCAPSPDSPVRVLGNAIEVALPRGATAVAFDQAVTRALAGASLAGWAGSAAGSTYCGDHAVDPERLMRGTPGAKSRICWSTEILLVRPRHDVIRLVRVCEDVIIELTSGLGR